MGDMILEIGQFTFGIILGGGIVFFLMMVVFTLLYEHDKKIHHQFEEDSFHLAQIQPIIDKIVESDFMARASAKGGRIAVSEVHSMELQKNIDDLRSYIASEMRNGVR